jgi:type IV secretory pathway VirB2 component (pilin)
MVNAMRAAFVSAVLLAAVAATAAAAAAAQPEDLDALLVRVRRDVRGMQDDIQQLFKYLLNGPGKGQVYNRLAYMTDTFGPRLSGSQAYDDAVQWIMQAATRE